MRSSAESAITMQPREITKSLPLADQRKARSPGAGWLRLLAFALVLTAFDTPTRSEPVHDRRRTPPLSTTQKPAVATELVDVVTAFVAAGEKDDPAARGKYLGPKVFYYGHARTHEQAVKEIAALYRRWPQRKFELTESIDLFEIPNHRGVYRVTAVYEYKFDNRDEHLSGKSKLTCVVEHDQLGTRITGLDEKLVSGSTVYQKD
jgi:hypothetical protein